MIWQEFLEVAAAVMGLTTEEAGISLSLIITMVVSFAFGILSREKTAAIMLGGMSLCIIFFIFMGWFPAWTGALLALIFAGLAAYAFGGK